jgi:hypothetical protein
MERHIGFYRTAGSQEAAVHRANAALTFGFLPQIAEEGGVAVPEDIFESFRPLLDEESTQINLLITSMTRLRDGFTRRESVRARVLSAGLGTWALSLRAFNHPVLLPSVREMWMHIERGQPEFDAVLLEYEHAGLDIGHAWTFEPPPAFLPC